MSNKTVILLLAILAVSAFAEETTAAEPVAIEDGVYVLTDKNFKDFIASKPFVLVEFYAPWCGHCKELAPEYASAAKAMALITDTVVLAKVDVPANEETAAAFDIQGFPTLKLFSSGMQLDYNGGRTSDNIVSWLKKRTLEPSTAINTAAELAKFKENSSVQVIFFGDLNSAEKKVFDKVIPSFDDIEFGYVTTAELAKSESSRVVLFKNFEELRNDFTGSFADETELKNFINKHSLPLVLPFNERAISKIFEEANPTLFLFSNGNEASLAAEAVFAQAAKANQGKVLFSVSKPDDGFGFYEKLAEYIGVDVENAPVLMLTKVSNEIQKYAFTASQISLSTVTSFVDDYVAGKLSLYLRSEKVPETNDEPVKVVVGDSFKDIVLNSNADVLVEFYAPWCGHCKNLEPKYNSAATKLLANKNIVLAKIDATANDVPGVNIEGFPTLKLYLNGKKDAPIDFENARTEAQIITKLKELTSHPWVDVQFEADPVQDHHGHDHHGHDHHDHDHHGHDHHDHDHHDHDHHSHDHEHKTEQGDNGQAKTDL